MTCKEAIAKLAEYLDAKLTPALGVMVVTFDNKSGADEAQLIKVDVK